MRDGRGLFAVMLTALLLVATSGERVEAQTGLFSAVSREETTTRRSVPGMPQGSGPSTVRRRLARIDLAQLAAARTRAARESTPRATLTLNLFDDAVVQAVVERTAPTWSGGYSLAGRIAGSAFGIVTLVVNGAVVAGTVRTPDGTFRIRTADDGLYELTQVDLSTLPPEAEPLVPEYPSRPVPGAPDAAGDPPSAADDASAIDMLIVYTPRARVAEGGPAEMGALIDLLVAETNQAFAESDASPRIRLVHQEAVNYTEDGDLSLDLNRITNPADGHMDDVHELRDTYGADYVHLISTGRNLCGIAQLMTRVSQDFAPYAFAVTNQRCALTFTHELGHNLGLRHDRYNDSGNTPYPYSHGYINQRAFQPGAPASARWLTIMAYGGQCISAGFFCRQVFRFSNLRLTWNGDPMGAPGDAPTSAVDGPADAARSLDQTRAVAASLRPRATTVTASLSPDPSGVEILPDGVWHRFTVDAPEPVDIVADSSGSSPRVNVAGPVVGADACPAPRAASVRSTDGQAIHLAACSLGTATVQLVRASDGTVLRNYVFEVRDRGTLSREREALVALYNATDGPNWTTRTNWLSEEPIWTWHGVDTDASGRVTKLDLGQNGLKGPIPEALADLSSLEVLHLYFNGLTGRIPEAFGNLQALWDLNLQGNQLTGPIPEALGDLPRLQWLTLRLNLLTGPIPPGLGELANLQWLILDNNRLTGSIPPVWSPELVVMSLSSNQLTGPISQTLGSVTELHDLMVERNALSGPLPRSLMDLGKLRRLHFGGNLSVCAPADAGFQAWLQGRDARGPTCSANRPPAAMGTLPDREMAVGGTLNVDLSQAFVDPDGDALLYRASSSAPQVVMAVPNGPRVTLGAASEGTAVIRVTASDPESLTAAQSFMVTVRANRPPEAAGVLAPLSIGVDEGPVAVDVSGAFRDPDDDALIYTATSSAPAVVSVSVSGSAVTVTPVSEGRSTVTVTATDAGGSNTSATQTFTVTVNPPANRPPEPVGALAPLTIGADEGSVAVDVSGAFRDPDDDVLTYEATSSSRGVATVSVSGSVVTVTPASEGMSTVTVTATDRGGSNTPATQMFRVTVNPPANRPPEPVGTLAPLAIGVDEGPVAVEVSGAFRDPDDDALTYEATSSSRGVATVSVSGSVVTVTPVSEGASAVTVTATDRGGSNATATQAFTVTVGAPANRPPEPVGVLAPLTIGVDEGPVAVEVSGAFRDRDGDALTYGATSSSRGVATVSVSGSVVTVSPASEGTSTVTVTATDTGGSNTPATQRFAVTVTPPANRPPEPVGVLGPLTIRVDEGSVRVEVSGAFRDPDDDVLTYGATSSSRGVATVSVSGSVVTVTPESEGTSTVTVTATDTGGSSGTATQTFAVTVSPPANRPPELLGTLAPLTIGVDEGPVAVDVSGAFRDPDGDALTYGATSSSPGVATVSVSGSVVTVTPVSEGTSTVTVTSTDTSGSNTPVTQTFVVTVGAPANRPPEPVGVLAPLRVGVDEAAVPVEVSGAFRDPDGDVLTYRATSSSPRVASVSVSGSVVTVTPVSEGRSTVTVTATDVEGSNTSATQAFLVTVTPPANRPPEPVGTLAPLTIEVGAAAATVDVSGAFRDPDGDRLTYAAISSAPAVASVTASGSVVTVAPVSAGTSTVTVTATDRAGSNSSATQTFGVTVQAPFTDDPIVPGVTPIKAVHFTELRARIDGLRTSAGLTRFAWTDPVLTAGVTPVRLQHLLELRAALGAAYRAAGRPAPRWTDARPAGGTTAIRAVHLTELRAAATALQ